MLTGFCKPKFLKPICLIWTCHSWGPLAMASWSSEGFEGKLVSLFGTAVDKDLRVLRKRWEKIKTIVKIKKIELTSKTLTSIEVPLPISWCVGSLESDVGGKETHIGTWTEQRKNWTDIGQLILDTANWIFNIGYSLDNIWWSILVNQHWTLHIG